MVLGNCFLRLMYLPKGSSTVAWYPVVYSVFMKLVHWVAASRLQWVWSTGLTHVEANGWQVSCNGM